MRCWTCGANIPNSSAAVFTCPNCKRSKQEIKAISTKFDETAAIQQQGFKSLRQGLNSLEKAQKQGLSDLQQELHGVGETVSKGFSNLASIVEWGFQDLAWKVEQQNGILRSIDQTLKTPIQTQANEWRAMAEELLSRGALNQAKVFYGKALRSNPLDYRTYIGLANTYLRANKFDKAKLCLQKSLPHAPEQEINYKSYSYRLLGHIHECEEDYVKAFSALKIAIELSPNYLDAYYDCAQYAVFVKKYEYCLDLLKTAIKKPLYFSLAQQEMNFEHIREDVQNNLIKIGLEGNLSKAYFDGLYALARYCAWAGKEEECIALLKQLITREPNFYNIIQNEPLFDIL